VSSILDRGEDEYDDYGPGFTQEQRQRLNGEVPEEFARAFWRAVDEAREHEGVGHKKAIVAIGNSAVVFRCTIRSKDVTPRRAGKGKA
jgi:hypothetical protein